MSLNNIELNPRLLADLYSGVLVGETQQHDFKFLGYNQKNVLVAVNYDDVIHLPDEQLSFLTTLLKACNLGLEDVAIINLNNYTGVDYNQILTYFKSEIVLLFGITTENFGFPFEIPEYQVQHFANRTIIHSAALHSIQNDKEAKGRLWAGLKNIFNL